MNTSVCSFERDSGQLAREASWYVWLPPLADEPGTVIPVCGDHVITLQTERPDAEAVLIASLADINCTGCGQRVWFAHPDAHITIEPVEATP